MIVKGTNHKFYSGDHALYKHNEETTTTGNIFTLTPNLSGKLKVTATLSGKSSSSSKNATELLVNNVLLFAVKSTSLTTEYLNADIEVQAGTPIVFSCNALGYQCEIKDICISCDTLPTDAFVSIS
jgi:hypothetical protein